VRWRDKIIFYPVHLTLFTSYFNANEEYERRFYSDSYDPYPGSGDWQQFEARDGFSETIFFDRKWHKQQHKRKPSKICSSNIMGRKSRVAVERRVKNMHRGEKSAKS